MWFTIFIAVATLVALMIIHELGHFVFAKKFGVEVEEFGLGLPPRIIGKKIGGTVYSLNLLPIGAFVKIKGEDGENNDPDSFSQKPIWQRAIILFAGVASFWVVSFIIFSILFFVGVPTAIHDEIDEDFSGRVIGSPRIMLVEIREDSPAEKAGLKMGDRITFLEKEDDRKEPEKVGEFKDFVNSYKGEEIVLGVQRGSDLFDVSLVPRVSPPQGEGSLGVALTRVGVLSYPWYESPLRALETCVITTYSIIEGLSTVFLRLVRGEPTEASVMGPVGIGGMISDQFDLGMNYFLQFIAIISLYLALFNFLPIPALDGGRLLFLGIEKVKGSSINKKIEQSVNGIFFLLLIGLMILVTVSDISKIF